MEAEVPKGEGGDYEERKSQDSKSKKVAREASGVRRQWLRV